MGGRLVEGPPLVIGGVTIPHSRGADAHSDGDAMYHRCVGDRRDWRVRRDRSTIARILLFQSLHLHHSIVDSILGALTLPDIGQLFPDNDPSWRGADSSIFMKEAFKRMDERGYQIGNLDVTLILQAPKVCAACHTRVTCTCID